MNGIKLNANGTVTIHGEVYSRYQMRAALEENMKAQRADNTSAYNHRAALVMRLPSLRWPPSYGTGRVARD